MGHFSSNVLIVGAGIAGLSLARILSKSGISVDLIEQQSRLHTKKSGLILSAQTLAVFRELGLEKSLLGVGKIFEQAEIRSYRDRLIASLDFSNSKHGEGTSIALPRKQFYQMLVDGLSVNRTRLDTSIRHLTQNDSEVEVEFSTGEKKSYALVVGADGVQSPVRSFIFGSRKAEFSGYYGWQWMVPTCPIGRENCVTEYWGKGYRLGLVPLQGGETYVYGFFHGPRHLDISPKYWSKMLRDQYMSFPSAVREVVEAVHHPSDIHLSPMMQVSMRKWHHGRVVLMGDAAHAISPNLGQGTALAIADAACLSKHLLFASSYPQALQNYEDDQWFRVMRIQRLSQMVGGIAQLKSPFASRLRNIIVRSTPRKWVLALANKAIL